VVFGDDDEEGGVVAKDNSIVFPVHEYTNEGKDSTFVRSPDIAVPEQEEKKKKFFKKDK
jgi:hypothetical protein